MAVSPEYRDWVLEQLREAGTVTGRSMFGGYGIYLDGAFFAVYVAGSYGEGEAATERALALIGATVEAVGRSAGRAEIARTADEVERIARAGRHAVILALEGGHALQASPVVLHGLA